MNVTLRWKPIRFRALLGTWSSGILILAAVTPVAGQQSSTSPRFIAQNIAFPPNITQLLEDFELTPIPCTSEAARIDVGLGIVCVRSSNRTPTGNYVYDPVSNQIRLLNRTGSSSSSAANSSSGEILEYEFTFTDFVEYSNCVEDILQFYKNHNQLIRKGRLSNCVADIFEANRNRGFSGEQALELVRAADAYATALQPRPLYPLRGIRRRVTLEFGFTYAIDRNP